MTASVPGKIMLAGEYAVLFGGRALAATIDRRLMVAATARDAAFGASVMSDLWDAPRQIAAGALAEGRAEDAEPLATAVAYGLKLFGLPGVELSVRSDLRVSYGVGSSSALRLGVLLALNEMTPTAGRMSHLDVARHAWILQRNAQALASGYDIATQLTGGLIEFRNPSAVPPTAVGPIQVAPDVWPVEITRLERLLEPARELVHPFVGGRGAPTGVVMGETLRWLDETGRLEGLLQASEELVDAFNVALTSRFDARAQSYLIRAVRQQRLVFEGSPHDPTPLVDALSRLPGFDQIWSFKTTGAGGEDAILLIGEPTGLAPATDTLYRMGWDRLPARLSEAGATAGGAA